VYLGRQIHQTNAQSQADARYSFLDAYGQMLLAVAQDKDLASVFRRGMQGLELDEDEAIQYLAYLSQFMNTWSVLFDLHVEGQLPDSQWATIRKDIITILSAPGGRAFWNDVGKLAGHNDFEYAVEKILTSGESSYKIV
jgi:hypothetical protein